MSAEQVSSALFLLPLLLPLPSGEGWGEGVKEIKNSMWTRGVRGATVAKENTKEAIIEATREMLRKMVEVNGIQADDIASAFFSTTRDLNAEFPAIAARQIGWTDAALMCMHEMDVPNSLPMCVRVLVHWNTDKRAGEIRHIYMNGAEKLRPDLIKEG